MDITYKLRVDAPYFRVLIDRYYRQRPVLLRPPARFALLAAVAIGLFLCNTSIPLKVALAISPVIAVALVVGGVVLTKQSLLRRFKRRADFGTEVTVTLLNDGLAASSQDQQGKWRWASYPRAVRYRDGILLLRAGVIRWLPDLAISAGTAEAATALVSSKTTLRRVA